MRSIRVFVPGPLQEGAEVALPESAVRHVVRALRLQPGAELIVFNGDGGEYEARLNRVERSGAWVAVGRFLDREAESPLYITLVQGISRGERMDYAIQKAVELGVNEIVPVFTERSVVQLKGDRAEKRQVHWQAVAQSACEQCGRNHVPRIQPPSGFAAWLAGWDRQDERMVLSPEGEHALSALPRPERPLTVLIGPEGGLDGHELELALGRGFRAIGLGPRILRTETAAVAVLAALQTLWGDFRR